MFSCKERTLPFHHYCSKLFTKSLLPPPNLQPKPFIIKPASERIQYGFLIKWWELLEVTSVRAECNQWSEKTSLRSCSYRAMVSMMKIPENMPSTWRMMASQWHSFCLLEEIGCECPEVSSGIMSTSATYKNIPANIRK